MARPPRARAPRRAAPRGFSTQRARRKRKRERQRAGRVLAQTLAAFERALFLDADRRGLCAALERLVWAGSTFTPICARLQHSLNFAVRDPVRTAPRSSCHAHLHSMRRLGTNAARAQPRLVARTLTASASARSLDCVSRRGKSTQSPQRCRETAT